MSLAKSDWVLLVLAKSPLDRIHIMKSLFLIWHRAKRGIQNYFVFEPYLYGPYSIDVYFTLEDLLRQGMVTQSPSPIQQWANYYLTEQGEKKAQEARKQADDKIIGLVDKTVEEVSHLSFFELLRRVYQEAPDFAADSVLRGLIKA